MPPQIPIVTVTLNTAIDRVLEVEHFAIGEHLPASEVSRFPAGKGVNLSRGLAQLGRDSIATGFAGAGESSQFEQLLKKGGPGRAVCQLLAVRGATRENITILDPVNHTDTHIRTAGFEATRQDVQRVVSKLGLLAREGAFVVFSGSLPPGMTPLDLDTLIYVALGGGAKVVLDLSGKLLAECSSVDLSIIGEEEAPATEGGGSDAAPSSEQGEATSASTSGGGGRMLWLVKPNRQELAEALGVERIEGEQALLDAGRRLTRRVSWVVLTLGAKGAILFGQEGTWRGWCDVKPDEIVSTVGCGDCMLAGVLDAQASGQPAEQVLRHGIAVATANAMRTGVAEYDTELVREVEGRTHVEAVAST